MGESVGSKSKLYKNPANYAFNCPCGRNFSLEKSFKAHKKNVHGEIIPLTYAIKDKHCPLCTFKSTSQTEMGEHFKIDHSLPLNQETLVFESKDQFLSWKQEEETKTSSKFIQIRGCQQFKSYTVFSYRCNRSGYYTPNGKGIRRLKTQGSEKINAFCPACINIKIESDGVCHVVYIATHIGHNQNDFLRRKDELIKQYMESIVLPEQLEYMESNFLIVSSTLSAMQEAHNNKIARKSKRKLKKLSDQNFATNEIDEILYHDYTICNTVS